MNPNSLPVAVIGAGPVGLAAAAHLLQRGLEPIVLEAGSSVGAGMLRWGHVRMFSPWAYTLDAAATAVLARHGWNAPDREAFPTGRDVVEQYLQPLAATAEFAHALRLNTRVQAVSRLGRDRMRDAQRDSRPFLVRYVDAQGEHELLARAVIDASGTIDSPSPLGASGLPALGERAFASRIAYGLPDVLGPQRARYAGKRVLVVGSGHSAFNVLGDLARLAQEAPDTHVQWAIRRPDARRVLGGGEHDQLAERGRLGLHVARLLAERRITLSTDFPLDRLEMTADGIVACAGERRLAAVDEIIACTGFRPDSGLLSELRLALDPGTEAPVALAPLIDPNLHSCGSVPPHGAVELQHPDRDVFIVGMKSYGRAPTFLLLTGYEQVRSVVAAIAGDWDAARRVELVLPETGVCITQFADDIAPATRCCGTAADSSAVVGLETADSGCCGGPPTRRGEACCAEDEKAKDAGAVGCGCSSARAPARRATGDARAALAPRA